MTMADRPLEFEDIYLSGKPVLTSGVFRITGQGLGWKGPNKYIVSAEPGEIRKLTWYPAAKGYELKVHLAKGGSEGLRFAGFSEDSFGELNTAAKRFYNKSLEKIETSIRGYNWGHAGFDGGCLKFDLNNRTAFEIPLSEVTNTAVSGKNEVSVEMKPLDSSVYDAGKKVDTLVEMRFFIPGQGGDEDSGDEEEDATQIFCDTIKDRAEIGLVKGDNLCSLKDIMILAPRGKYDLDVYAEFLRMHGKTYDYKIPYENITRLFLLPKGEELMLFVIGLKQPIRQGQTRYPYLVCQISRDEEEELTLKIDDEELQEKYAGKLQKTYYTTVHEILRKLLNSLAKKVPETPSSDDFTSNYGSPSVKCSWKAHEGQLYPLEKSLIFLPKPTMVIDHSDILSITLSRDQNSTVRSFDMRITQKSGGDNQFSSIPKDEYKNLNAYFTLKNLRVKSELDDDNGDAMAGVDYNEGDASAGSDEDSPDEDFEAGTTSESSDGEESSSDSADMSE